MTSLDEKLSEAYLVGEALALQEGHEKLGFVPPALLKGIKFLTTGGHLGKPGSLLSKLSPHHVGAPVAMGLFSMAGAEEGDRAAAFGRGVVGGLAFNVAAPLGTALGKRLLAPGLRGKNAIGFMRRLGFGDAGIAQMDSARKINKAIHSGGLLGGGTQRALASGNYSGKNISNALKSINPATLETGAATTLKELKTLFTGGIPAGEQAAALARLKEFSTALYKSGLATGPRSAQFGLKASRFAKGLGAGVGSFALGMPVSMKVEESLHNQPPSYFNNYGGH